MLRAFDFQDENAPDTRIPNATGGRVLILESSFLNFLFPGFRLSPSDIHPPPLPSALSSDLRTHTINPKTNP